MNKARFDQMLIDQDNACAICGKSFNDEPWASVDHDHSVSDRENYRGLLCVTCNRFIGMIESPLYDKAIKYLDNALMAIRP